MSKKSPSPTNPKLPRWYRGANIPMRLIRSFARQIAERFQPEKIILFGSYAYGTPHEELDRFALADVRAAVGAPIE